MKTYRVWGTCKAECYIDVWADSEEEAFDIADGFSSIDFETGEIHEDSVKLDPTQTEVINEL